VNVSLNYHAIMGQAQSSSNREPLISGTAVTAEIAPGARGSHAKLAMSAEPAYTVSRHPADPYESTRQTVVLAIDGGGMRGIIPG
jgi:hypothetical protein